MPTSKVWEILNTNYVNKGLMIFPVIKNGKTPAIKEWQNDCSSNYMQILYWITNAKDCNWGMPATPNNLFIIDCDRHDINKDGVVNFDKLLKDLGINNINTLTQKTQSNGIHYIFKSDKDLKGVSNAANIFEDYPGIDCRSDGYIVVEPSEIDSRKYEFINNVEPIEMPKELKDYIINHAGTKATKKKTRYAKPKETIETGDRDNQLFTYINDLYYHTKLDYDEIMLLANNFNETMFDDPLEDKDVKYKVKKCFEKDRGNRIIINVGEDSKGDAE